MATDADIAAAVRVLQRGGLVAFPTETVYGLGCDAENVDALRRLYAVKRRPAGHPVIVHLAGATALPTWMADVPSSARALADAFWPGPLTLVGRKSARVPSEATGGGDTVAIRVPDQPVALALLAQFDGGIAAPSANRFGRVSPTTAEHVHTDLGDDVDVVLDGGPCRVGVESTIVDCSGERPAILRLGAIPRAQVESLIGPVDERIRGEIAAPGTTPAHYAPDARIELVGVDELTRRAASLLSAGARVGALGLELPSDAPMDLEVLGSPSDIDDYARVLYQRLREADQRGLEVLLVVSPPATGVGAAVADRLERAAAGSAVSATP